MNTQRQKVENSRIILYLHDFAAHLLHKKYRFIFAERLFSDILNLSKYNTHHKHETALQVQETQTVKPYVLCKQKDINIQQWNRICLEVVRVNHFRQHAQRALSVFVLQIKLTHRSSYTFF